MNKFAIAAAPRYLSTQSAHVRLDDVGLRIKMKLPHTLQKHCSCYHSLRMSHEELQKTEFAGLQLDLLSAARSGAFEKIELQIVDPKRGRQRGEGGTATQRLEPRQQLSKSEWLDEIVVAISLQTLNAIS